MRERGERDGRRDRERELEEREREKGWEREEMGAD